jgi:hypothetical protein
MSQFANRPDFALVSQIVSEMNFFKVFDHMVRMKLLFIGEHGLFTPGETIITVEELEAQVLVVLSGLVQVVVVDEEVGAEFHRMVLYPGDSLG